MEENNEVENVNCQCDWPNCPRHGKCSECQEYHNSRGERTNCGR